MNSVYKLNGSRDRFDLSAIKIFFSIIAIFLSVTMPNANAVTDSSNPYQSSLLSKIIYSIEQTL